MSIKFELQAEPREAKGTGASRRLRRQGQVPAILYGAGQDAVMFAVSHDVLFHQIQNEAFFTSIVTVKLDGKTDQAVVRDLQMHPYKPRVQHLDLLRVSASEKIHIAIPLHFVGGDIAPGIKQQGGILSHLVTEVDVSCLPAQLPEFLTVDVSALSVGDSIHMSDLKVPEGVSLTALGHGNDLAVATISMVRAAVEAEGRPEAPAEAAPAAEAKEAPKKEGK